MKVYTKEWVQILPITLEEAWSFFSRPENLMEITPDDFKLIIKTDIKNIEVYQGMLIEYTVKPMFNIPMNWLTEITQVNKPNYFIDEQRFGPYALWHHEHHFEAVPEGIKMTDKLFYAIPFWWIGRIANALFVEKKVEEIFEFRYKKLEKLFPLSKASVV